MLNVMCIIQKKPYNTIPIRSKDNLYKLNKTNKSNDLFQKFLFTF